MHKLLSTSLFLICACVSGFAQDAQPKPTATPGNGIGSGNGGGEIKSSGSSKSANVRGVRILSKPRANYTQAARMNDIEGYVRLRITFLASGEIGDVIPITGLPYDLTEQAIAAARQIKFEPQMKDGIPVTVSKIVEYGFWIYYRENDKDLAKNASILKMPAPEHPQKSDFRKIGGKVQVKVVFDTDGSLRVTEVSSDLPKDFQDAARKAASQIKFDPAIHKNGNVVAQSKVIEYEFKPQND
ncbi:MAG TPA: TonB family protein [Pyrinomonadaceae bacterium]|jgi:TonB family protein